MNADELPIEKTLRVQWNMETDILTIKILPKDKPYTRRGILSVTSSIYDPLGFVSPVVLPAKRLIQDLCKQGLGWDKKIGKEETARWEKWLSDLPKLSHISVPQKLRSFITSMMLRRWRMVKFRMRDSLMNVKCPL